jgi:DNA invertase Pin-like site-specific DNA recombinase
MEDQKKVAIYCRISKGKDQTNENQTLELERYAKAMNFDYEIFEEEESSRKTRPIKNQVFQDALAKKWDQILVMRLDRWARSLQELVNDIEQLRQGRVEFYSLKDNLKISYNPTPTEQLTLNILGAIGQFERDIIRARTNEGLDRARANGKRLGRPPKK